MTRSHGFPKAILAEIKRLHGLRLGARLMAATLIATGKVEGTLSNTVRKISYAKRALGLPPLSGGKPRGDGKRRLTEAERLARRERRARIKKEEEAMRFFGDAR